MMRILILLALLGICTEASIGSEAALQHRKGRTIQSMRTYLAGLKEAIRNADVKREVIYLNNIAVLFNEIGNIDSSRVYFNAAKKAAALSVPLTAITELNIAFLEKRYFSIAGKDIEKWEDSLTVFESAALYIAVGRMELGAGKHKIAESHFERVLKLLKKENKSVLYADALLNLGKSQLSRKEFAKAEQTLEKALAIFQGGGFTPGISRSLNALSEAAKANGRHPQAEQYQMLLKRLPTGTAGN